VIRIRLDNHDLQAAGTETHDQFIAIAAQAGDDHVPAGQQPNQQSQERLAKQTHDHGNDRRCPYQETQPTTGLQEPAVDGVARVACCQGGQADRLVESSGVVFPALFVQETDEPERDCREHQQARKQDAAALQESEAGISWA
jgi:hypothetical protein